MRALLINAVCGIRSTGRICIALAQELEFNGYEVKIAYGRENVPEEYKKYAIRIGNNVDVYWHALMGRCLDQRGYCSKIATQKFLKWAEEYNPDLLWLHNIHDYFINIEMLFDWIKSRPKMQVKWTQHDCWAFTGGCMHFIVKNCFQWENGCLSCPRRSRKKFMYREKSSFLRKKRAFTGVSNMTIISVSNWLRDLVSKSFLKEYPGEVVYNTVDKTVFKPTESDFRERNGLIDKKIVLGVSSVWNESKGLYDFIRLSEMLDDSYKVVLVGVSKKLMKKNMSKVLCIPSTNNTKELAQIYTSADVFVNPSREETFGLTTLEAICCGTEAVVYKNTACEEVVSVYGGIAVDQSVDALFAEIERICNKDKLT